LTGIRVTYSGLISFAVSLLSVLTGVIFTLVVTRQLTQDEFGAWGLIGSMTGYVLIFGPITTYWVTREIARGEKSGKTSLITTGFFGTGAIIIYLIISTLFETQVEIELSILLFAAITIPIEYVRSSLQSITLGYKPQIRSYGLLTFELVKIPIGFILIYFLEMGLVGAILTIAVASTTETILLAIKTREKLKGQFNKTYFKKWSKLFWIPTYPKISNRIMNLDVVVFSLITGSVSGLAFWAASNAISKVVANSGQISISVYGKLLQSGKKEFLQENLIRTFYFSIPLVAMSITFAKPGLFTLNPIYEMATNIVIIMSLVVFLRTLDGIFDSALTGIEKVDLKEDANFKDYIKSKLFYIPTIRLIHRSVYLVSVSSILLILTFFSFSDVELITYWALVSLIIQIPFSAYFYKLVKNNFGLKIDKNSILKYLFSATVSFGITYLLMEEFLVYKESIFEFLPGFLPFVVVGVGGYLGLTFLIDLKIRELFKLIIKEMIKK
jgi:hypothetical protein